MKPTVKNIIRVSVFAIAMAYLEAAVVVYLRLHYYPGGFDFPLKIVAMNVGIIEIVREFMTVVMLAAVAALAGNKFLDKFFYFCYNFGLWDIFYYVWLKVMIGWPESLFTWDVLFLIPAIWTGPVLAPVTISLCLCGSAVTILLLLTKGVVFRFGIVFWILEALCGLVVIETFLWNHGLVLQGGIPRYFPWGGFWAGVIVGLGVFLHVLSGNTLLFERFRTRVLPRKLDEHREKN